MRSKMIRAGILLSIPLALFSTTARATPALLCDDIALGDKVACAAEVEAKCRNAETRRDTKCMFGVVAKYDRCATTDYVAACRAAGKAVEQICRGTDFDGNDPASIKAWTERIKKYDATVKSLKEYWAAWGACYDMNNECSLSQSDATRCENAADDYKKTWADHMEWTRSTTLAQSMDRAQQFAGQKNARDYQEAVTDLKGAIDLAEKDLQTNALGFIRVDPKPLEEAIAKAKKAAGGYAGKARAEIAAARCPKGKFEDASLAKTLRAVADESRQAQTKDTGLSVKFETFRFLGAPWEETEMFTRRVFQYASAGTCERQTSGGETHCRVIELKFRRSKSPGGGFGGWSLDATGGGDEVLCENVNK